MKRCSKCKQIKPFSEFGRNVTRKDGYQHACNSCKNEERTARFKTPKGRASLLRQECVKRSRKNGRKVELTDAWIEEQILKGCPLTGVQFDLENVNSPWSPSVDRIDSSRDYTEENSRVIVSIANFAKNQWDDLTLLEFATKLLNNTGSSNR